MFTISEKIYWFIIYICTNFWYKWDIMDILKIINSPDKEDQDWDDEIDKSIGLVIGLVNACMIIAEKENNKCMAEFLRPYKTTLSEEHLDKVLNNIKRRYA